MEIPGPFSSGVLYLISFYDWRGMTYGGYNLGVSWWVNSYDFAHGTKGFLVDKYCDDTIKVEVEIY